MMAGFLKKMMGKKKPEPEGIDCEEVMAQLYEYIDGELECEGTTERVRKHLDLCKRCYPHYDFERAFLRFVSEQGRTNTPPELRRKVFQAMLEEEDQH